MTGQHVGWHHGASRQLLARVPNARPEDSRGAKILVGVRAIRARAVRVRAVRVRVRVRVWSLG